MQCDPPSSAGCSHLREPPPQAAAGLGLADQARKKKEGTVARISGVDIPREKRLEISLTYIYGIGLTSSQRICDSTGTSRDTRVRDLTDEEVTQLRTYIDANFADEKSQIQALDRT